MRTDREKEGGVRREKTSSQRTTATFYGLGEKIEAMLRHCDCACYDKPVGGTIKGHQMLAPLARDCSQRYSQCFSIKSTRDTERHRRTKHLAGKFLYRLYPSSVWRFVKSLLTQLKNKCRHSIGVPTLAVHKKEKVN